MTTTTAIATAQDARHQPLTEADKLRQDAESAAQVRRLANHPDVIALRVEKVRTQIDVLLWVGIFLGLAFTMVNVQAFAASGSAPWSLGWLSAWLLDPMVSLVLVAVLRAEQITARYQVQTGKWAHRTKWFAFLATYVMNTWKSWVHLDVAGVALHSVPPVLVFLAAETAPVLRDKLTEAVMKAAGHAFTGEANTEETAPAAEATPADTPDAEEPVPTPALSPATAPRRTTRKAKAPAKQSRKLRGDYLAEARAAWAPGIEITPAWVREVCPEVSRGTSKNVADDLIAETRTAPTVLPVSVANTTPTDTEEAA
ncbi:hypothetical protein [Amycolatopsis sp. EV170708-02-1]|uniref:hypothetical protein n=1 Tax=Amycolatopsis sp. EV170708-02-1 TaxID=2919322 RepID=UPI001F0CD7C7|nr:hypothetical protein [Amycolatopsis sp. EV170708-02-1]UMP02248.1 hypothetical protein MJQ72_38615 [Amycolatopsis sp. EV170708-02-1]